MNIEDVLPIGEGSLILDEVKVRGHVFVFYVISRLGWNSFGAVGIRSLWAMWCQQKRCTHMVMSNMYIYTLFCFESTSCVRLLGTHYIYNFYSIKLREPSWTVVFATVGISCVTASVNACSNIMASVIIFLMTYARKQNVSVFWLGSWIHFKQLLSIVPAQGCSCLHWEGQASSPLPVSGIEEAPVLDC